MFRKIWTNDIVKEAIFLGSPELFIAINKWFEGEIVDLKKVDRLKISLLKYLSRMSSRCTPFGLFAGCSIGELGESTVIELKPNHKHHRQTRFDMNFLVAFSQKLARIDYIQKQLRWFPNNSIYKIGEQYRYVEYIYNTKNRREHSIEAVTHTPYLESILEHAKSGKKIEELTSLLVNDHISIQDAEEFIELLIQNQIIVSEIEPSVTGQDFLIQLSNNLKKIKNTESIINQIDQYQKHLDQIDEKIGNTTQVYLDLSKSVKKTNTPFELKYLFQVDLYTEAIKNQLDIRFGYQIKRAMVILNKMSLPSQNSTLQQFKDAFKRRYETREIPLSTVLDTEIGIGYRQDTQAVDSNLFLDGLQVPHKHNLKQKLQWDPIKDILNNKLQQANSEKLYTIQLFDKDFENLDINWTDLPDSISTITEVFTLDNQEKIALSSIGGASAAALLARFSAGNQTIFEYVQHVATIEEQMHPEKLIAEIIHLPESRTGNVIRRAVIRKYEIPYLGKSSLPIEQQLPIQDLMLSIKNNTLVLRSKKHNKTVLPRLTNAHNYSRQNSLPIYHFLCDMQKQNMRGGIAFNWGETLEKNKFLPRVEYKNFIFSKARWRISKKDVAPFLDDIETKNNYLIKVTKWRKKLLIPKYVQLIDKDNTLLINFENKESTLMWLNTIKNREEFLLEEFLFIEDSPVKQGSNKYTNQCVFSFYKETKVNQIPKKDTVLYSSKLSKITVKA
ncbi:lantibiotic dehydratase family protein [Aquimarina sp. M1]